MLFLGTDTDDLSELGAEFEICMGKERERHKFHQVDGSPDAALFTALAGWRGKAQ